MILGKTYFQFDDRAFEHPGVVIDMGCLRWDWSRRFTQRGKRVIGFDPQETQKIEGAELRNQLVMPHHGKLTLKGGEGGASVLNNRLPENRTCEVVSFDSVLSEFNIMPSIVKMNIEGAEYFILFSLKSPPADQLVVAFHDWGGNPFTEEMSAMTRDYLSKWYDWTEIFKSYSWWLGLLKDEYRKIK